MTMAINSRLGDLSLLISRSKKHSLSLLNEDGAGRVGKMLFARQGMKFNYDLKRLGDLLMELGAGIELPIVVMPHLFLDTEEAR